MKLELKAVLVLGERSYVCQNFSGTKQIYTGRNGEIASSHKVTEFERKNLPFTGLK